MCTQKRVPRVCCIYISAYYYATRIIFRRDVCLFGKRVKNFYMIFIYVLRLLHGIWSLLCHVKKRKMGGDVNCDNKPIIFDNKPNCKLETYVLLVYKKMFPFWTSFHPGSIWRLSNRIFHSCKLT